MSGVHRYGLEWAARLDSPRRLATWLREQRTLLFYREGHESVIAVLRPRGSERRFLSINGKTDAGSGREDVVQQKFVAHVPMLLHPAPKRVLVIGWGSGASAASAALYPVDSVECVEIEPATWEAAPFFADLSGRLKDDPRFRIAFRDARNHVLRSAGGWDVIAHNPTERAVACDVRGGASGGCSGRPAPGANSAGAWWRRRCSCSACCPTAWART